MQIITLPGRFRYIADTGDWRLEVAQNFFEIQPQVGNFFYQSGTNLENLAVLINQAKNHAIANGIDWDGN